MNTNLATLIAPLGCFTRSGGSCSFQRATQAYVRDVYVIPERQRRVNLIRAVLGSRRLTPGVETVIRSHLSSFELRDCWSELTPERRSASVREVYERIRAAASGRANGTAVFPSIEPMSVDKADEGECK